jgi:hypothetical protein
MGLVAESAQRESRIGIGGGRWVGVVRALERGSGRASYWTALFIISTSVDGIAPIYA